MHYEEEDFGNGLKVRYRVFDYDTPEGWSEYVNATYGSVTDETFVDPDDVCLFAENR